MLTPACQMSSFLDFQTVANGLMLRDKDGANKASHGGLAVTSLAIYIQMHC